VRVRRGRSWSARCQYDAERNRTHRFIDANQNGQLDSGDTDITEYTWDHRNRLVKVEHRPGYAAAVDKVVEYAYDYENRWVRKRLDADGDGHTDQRRLFAYDGNQIVLDFWRANSGDLQVGHLRERYLWGPAVDQILAEENVDNGADETVQWTVTDHLNTVRDIAKFDPQTGATTVVNHLVYDAFGNVTSESNPAIDTLFLFTGRPFDTHTGLQNNLNRWYDPAVGRWLSEDPIGFAGGDSNLYRYVGHRVTSLTDAVGEDVHHPYPLYLGGSPQQPCIVLSPDQHRIATEYFRKAIGYGEEGRLKWANFSPAEQRLHIIKALKEAGVPDDVIQQHIDEIMRGAKPGVKMPRIRPTRIIGAGAALSAVFIVLTDAGTAQAAEISWDWRDTPFLSDLDKCACECARFRYVVIIPSWWNIFYSEERGMATRVSNWVHLGVTTRAECRSLEGYEQIVGEEHFIGFTVYNIETTICRFGDRIGDIR